MATTNAVNALIQQTSDGLVAVIHVVTLIIQYIIRRYTKLLTCLLDLAISGSVGSVDTYANQVRDYLNVATSSINSGLSSLVTSISTLGGWLPDVNPSTVQNQLDQLIPQLPTEFITTLQSLSSSIPSMTSLEEDLENFVTLPFSQMEQLVIAEFNRVSVNQVNVFPTPAGQFYIVARLPVPALTRITNLQHHGRCNFAMIYKLTL